MDKNTFTPIRLALFLIIASLVLGLGFSVAQTQNANSPAGDTPKSVAQTPAESPNGATQGVEEEPAAADAADAAAKESEPAADNPAAERTLSKMRGTTQAQRKAASAHARARLSKGINTGKPSGLKPSVAIGNPVALCNAPTGQATADYMGLCPNWSQSPLLHKFIDSLPGLGLSNANNLGQYIPIAVPDTTTYPGDANTPAADYYQIGVKEYREQMHTDMPNGTKLRGYLDLNSGVTTPHYLGPLIIARRDRPVRIKFTNMLLKGTAGNLFLPVDTTVMGAGNGPDGTPYLQNRATLHLHGGNTPWISDGTPHQWTVPAGETTNFKKGASNQDVPDMPASGDGNMTFYYTNQQSGRLMFYHDHSYGLTRLNVYAGEAAGYLLTDKAEDDLINGNIIPGAPLANNPYAYGIPLIIQDKTFVAGSAAPATGTFLTDPTWPSVVPAGTQEGDLWFPHVYMPNQNPSDNSGANAMGRWDYGPWFWPPQTNLTVRGVVPCPTAANPNQVCPGTPNPSLVPEAFMDTPVINGTAYPYATLEAKPTRFRILNATNDRHLNLQLYVAEPLTIAVTNGGSGYTAVPNVTISAAPGGAGSGATATAILSTGSVTSVTGTGGSGYVSPTVSFSGGGIAPVQATGVAILSASGGVITGIQMTSGGSGYTSAPTVAITDANHTGTQFAAFEATITPAGSIAGVTVTNPGSNYKPAPVVTIDAPASGTTATAIAAVNTEVKMLDAFPHSATSALPSCGPEQKAEQLYLGGTTTGLPQNCWPAAWPTDGRDGGVPDPTTAGPAMIQIGTEGGLLPAPVVIPSTPVGYNYNRRDIVVLNVQNKGLFLGPAERADVIVDFSGLAGKTLILYNDSPAPVPASDPRLDYYTGDPDQTDSGGAPTTLPGFGPNIRTMMQIRLVAPAGNVTPFSLSALKTSLPQTFAADNDQLIVPESAYTQVYNPGTPYPDTYSRIETTSMTFTPIGSATSSSFDLQPKAIQELFTTDYGRMNATLGVELPLTNFLTQTTIPLGFIDPPTEVMNDGETQIWKVTHNGVDTHAIHFHLFNVQLLNRVGWDGAIRPPDPNEMGWKETVRMNPLEDAIVAIRPMKQKLPFGIPDSQRPLDVTMPLGTTGQFTNIDPLTNNPVTVYNTSTNFGWEYVWHCHLLGHEENDMMRPIVFKVQPVATPVITSVNTANTPTAKVNWFYTDNPAAPATGFRILRTQGNTTAVIAVITNVATRTFTDTTVAFNTTYTYKMVAFNASGVSLLSNGVTVTTPSAPVVQLPAPTGLTSIGLLLTTNSATLTWNSVNGATKYIVERALSNQQGAVLGAWTVVGQPTVPTLRVTGLTTSTYYLFRVSAANGNAGSQSNPSGSILVKTR
jgi:FtsP/CotA-like multicopper oxidase with cupredoxin domain